MLHYLDVIPTRVTVGTNHLIPLLVNVPRLLTYPVAPLVFVFLLKTPACFSHFRKSLVGV